jgi:AbiV family abortive infection protein
MVTPEYLMQGAHYALEQCGLLLCDAVHLYRRGSYATVTVLAAFAREELGKARELRSMRREMLDGATFTVQDIKRRCGCNHVVKQERGQTSTVLRFTTGSELDKLHRIMFDNHPQSEVYRKAELRFQEIVAEDRRRTPEERHRTRMSCLYVDPDETADSWNLPKDQTKDEALAFVAHAINDYRVQHDKYQLGNVGPDGRELYDALQKWTDRPELPAPESLW